MNLPKPKCRYGFTTDQLTQILGPTQLETFSDYMRGQTMTLCEGKEWSQELNKYIPTNCGPHGPIVYLQDLESFLEGRPPLD
jgi:hypothetical protein